MQLSEKLHKLFKNKIFPVRIWGGGPANRPAYFSNLGVRSFQPKNNTFRQGGLPGTVVRFHQMQSKEECPFLFLV